jgi:hypothetical protein
MKIKIKAITPVRTFTSKEKKLKEEQYREFVRIVESKGFYSLNLELDDSTVLYLKNDLLNRSAILITVLEQ